jgi:signal transduction histidine kinase
MLLLGKKPRSEPQLLSVEEMFQSVADSLRTRKPANVEFKICCTTNKAGTGLGMMIVKQVVLQHSGRVHVESQPGAGTTIQLSLPAAPLPATKTSGVQG